MILATDIVDTFKITLASFLIAVLNFLNGWIMLCLREMLLNYIVMTNGYIYMNKINKLDDIVNHSECA